MKTSPWVRHAVAAWIAACATSAVQAADCIGNCGESLVTGADVIGALPSGGSSYNWVSTNFGQTGAGQLEGFGGTNGSSLTSDAFYAAAGSKVEFYFNYVTSDGAGYADYAWSKLVGASSSTTLFTARTQPTGSIAPGFGLPGVTATLSPSEVAIIPGGPTWAPLGGSSGSCYDAGCGYTGWIKSTYEIQTAGTYQLSFGVTNWQDEAFDSGLAFQGLLLNGAVIGATGYRRQQLAGRRSDRKPPVQLASLRSLERLSLRRSVGLEGWRRSDTERPSPGRDHDLANEPWDCVCQGKHRLKFA